MKNILVSIKRGYYYLFYKFYKFGEASPSIFPSDFTATFAILSLELLFFISLKFYYIEFIDQSDEFELVSFQTFFALGFVVLVNYYAFIDKPRWKKYVNEFDQWPQRKNILGTWIVLGIVVFVICSLAFSFYMMGQITGIN